MFDINQVINFFKKAFTRKDVLFIFLIIGLYLLTRLINLDQFPIFCDEGIYIRWAKVAWHDASWRFISLTDGKQPLQTWATIPFLKLLPNNALLAGRLFAVTSGLLALIGMFTLLYYLWGKRAAILGSFFYVITPYFLIYDRLALVDSMVNAGFIWIFFFIIYLIKEKRLSTALILGMVGGMFLLAKSSVRLFLMLGVMAPLLIFTKNIKKLLTESINYYVLFGISLIIALVIYNVQRLSPYMHFVDQKNLTFVMSFSEFLSTPLQYFSNNIRYVPLYLLWEGGFVIPILGIIGLILLIKKDWKLGLYIMLWFIAPFVAIVFFTKVLFPRYIIFLFTLLFISFAYLLSLEKIIVPKIIKTIIILLIFSFSIFFIVTYLFIPKFTPFPEVDRGQYLEGWPAGWGVKETIEMARTKSKTKPVVILAEGNFGMAADVLDVHLIPGDKITIKGYWPMDEKQLFENQPLLKDHYVYVFFSHRKEFPDFWPIKLIKVIEKPGLKSDFRLFELLPNK